MEYKEFDLCVIGAGPAGIIVALEYAKLNPKKEVLLIEFGKGKLSKNSLDDSIKIKDMMNYHPVYECTNKGLGGSSISWGGRCVTYDEVDFIDRPILNGGCTWDTNLFNEVNEYLPDAASYFECGKPVFTLKDFEQYKNTSIAEGFIEENVTDKRLERWSIPTRFGPRYRKAIKNTPNMTLLEGYEARNFYEPNPANKTSALKLRTLDGKFLNVKAKCFVIASGAQETTRLLLKNPGLFNNMGDVPDALGKYYQGHLSGKIASVVFNGDPKRTEFGFIKDDDGVYLRRRFQFKKDYLIRNNLLNTAIWLDNPLYHNPKHNSGTLSLMYLAMITPILGKKLAPPAIKDSITKGVVENLGSHFLNILKDFPGSFLQPALIFYKRYLINRKLPGVFLFNKNNEYTLHFHSEQIPSKNNRMQLGSDGESLEIDYSLTAEDINSVISLHNELDISLRKSKCGKLKYWFPKNEMADAIRKMSRDGIHQTGTTRIAGSKEEGVVDRNLLLYGSKNVYICSSSVFPTSSQANPTFYLGAFAVRLAHFLSKN